MTVDVLAEAGQRLVDRVVDDFVDEVVQPGRPGRPDVHRRPLPDGLEAFEDLDFVGAVVVGTGRTRPAGVCQLRVGHRGTISEFVSSDIRETIPSLLQILIGMIT